MNGHTGTILSYKFLASLSATIQNIASTPDCEREKGGKEMSVLTYNHIGLLGASVGSAHLKEDKIEWRDRSNQPGGEFAKGNIKKITWEMVGSKGYLKVYMADGTMTSMDGFSQTDYENIKEFVSSKYGIELTREQVRFCKGGLLGF